MENDHISSANDNESILAILYYYKYYEPCIATVITLFSYIELVS